MKLQDIASTYKLELTGDPDHVISNIRSFTEAASGDITFVTSSKYIPQLRVSQAGCIITTKELAQYATTNVLISPQPYLIIAKLSGELKSTVTPTPLLSPYAVISQQAHIGSDTIIDGNAVIEHNVTIGKRCHIAANVTIHEGTHIGDDCIISAGAVIGSEGFGNILTADGWQHITHFGNVHIGDNVHIGANTTIDRGTFANTTIADGVRIDNLVHIAHNVEIGEHTAIAALCGIAGSTIIGKRCQIAGKVGIIGHLTIADDVTIYATSTVHKSLVEPGSYTGFIPIMSHSKWKKIALHITKFDKICKLLNIKIGKL